LWTANPGETPPQPPGRDPVSDFTSVENVYGGNTSMPLRVRDNFVGEQDRLAGVAGQAGIVWL
jgi:hypothetical protein